MKAYTISKNRIRFPALYFANFLVDNSGSSASVYVFTLAIPAVAWFICWHTGNFIKDDSWPYLLISNYFVVFFCKNGELDAVLLLK